MQKLISIVHYIRYYGFINAGAATTGVDIAASSQAISSGETGNHTIKLRNSSSTNFLHYKKPMWVLWKYWIHHIAMWTLQHHTKISSKTSSTQQLSHHTKNSPNVNYMGEADLSVTLQCSLNILHIQQKLPQSSYFLTIQGTLKANLNINIRRDPESQPTAMCTEPRTNSP